MLAMVAVGLVVTSWQTGLFSLIADPPRLREVLREMGAGGYAVFLLAFTFLSPFGLPGIAFVIAAAYIWPGFVAYVLSVAGALGASIVGFLFARFIARDWVASRLPPRLKKYDAWIEKRGWIAAAGLRAIFLMHPLLHASFGVSRIGMLPYVLGCTLGYLPSLAVVTWASGGALDYLKSQPKERFIAIAVGLLALELTRRLVTWWWRRRRAGQQRLAPQRAEPPNTN